MKVSISNAQARQIYVLIKDITLTKLDKDVRVALLRNYIALEKIAESTTSDIETMRKKLIEGQESRIEELGNLRSEMNKDETTKERRGEIEERISKDFADIMEIEKTFGDTIDRIMSESSEVELIPVSEEDIMEAVISSGHDFKAQMLELFRPIIKAE